MELLKNHQQLSPELQKNLEHLIPAHDDQRIGHLVQRVMNPQEFQDLIEADGEQRPVLLGVSTQNETPTTLTKIRTALYSLSTGPSQKIGENLIDLGDFNFFEGQDEATALLDLEKLFFKLHAKNYQLILLTDNQGLDLPLFKAYQKKRQLLSEQELPSSWIGYLGIDRHLDLHDPPRFPLKRSSYLYQLLNDPLIPIDGSNTVLWGPQKAYCSERHRQYLKTEGVHMYFWEDLDFSQNRKEKLLTEVFERIQHQTDSFHLSIDLRALSSNYLKEPSPFGISPRSLWYLLAEAGEQGCSSLALHELSHRSPQGQQDLAQQIALFLHSFLRNLEHE